MSSCGEAEPTLMCCRNQKELSVLVYTFAASARSVANWCLSRPAPRGLMHTRLLIYPTSRDTKSPGQHSSAKPWTFSKRFGVSSQSGDGDLIQRNLQAGKLIHAALRLAGQIQITSHSQHLISSGTFSSPTGPTGSRVVRQEEWGGFVYYIPHQA